SAFFTLTEFVRPQIFSIRFAPSESDRLPVAARIARREIAAVQLPDKLRAAELVVIVHRHDPMPARLQCFDGGRREAVLDADLHALHDTEARAVAGGLRALAVVGDAHQHLRVALRLHRAAHYAEAHHRLAVLGEEAGDDGLIRT